MVNAADPNAVRKSEQKSKSARDRELNDFRFIVQTPEGRRYVWRLLSATGVFRTSFTGNSTTFFNEGMRNIGLMIMADLNEACPERYQQMMNEARHEEANA
jgi:hypothetical protein